MVKKVTYQKTWITINEQFYVIYESDWWFKKIWISMVTGDNEWMSRHKL